MRYATDLADDHWNLLRPLLPARSKTGRPPTDRRLVVDGILYLLRAGCAWRMLPKEYGPWSTVYGVFRLWVKQGIWERVHNTLRTKVRQADGRQPAPTAAILDSQTVKVGDQGGVRGYDAGKKTAGRKRHILVDVLGLLLGVYVGSADEQDRDGAKTCPCPGRKDGTFGLPSCRRGGCNASYRSISSCGSPTTRRWSNPF